MNSSHHLLAVAASLFQTSGLLPPRYHLLREGMTTDEMPRRFGEVLRQFRAAAGLSQEALAARSGISVDAISMLERGIRSSPRNSTVVRLVSGLRLGSADRERLLAAAQERRDTASERIIPRELPRPPADFTGRTDELDSLISTRGHVMVINAIDGMGGVGKSALAIHAAHRLVEAGEFPDGQLYVNLQGATAGLPPLAPLDVLGRLLRSLGEDPSSIPTEVEEAAARFRSLTAGLRLLVVLDNAVGANQVRPLLPGNPTCGVLITSRQVLATLEGTQALHLNVLPSEDAMELLGRLGGKQRIVAERAAAAEVVRLCGNLPLAIRIAGARLAARPSWPVHEIANQLADATRRLQALQAGELAVHASFDVSLRSLRESQDPIDRQAAAVFGLLSLPDGPDLSLAAAARLVDADDALARVWLERLVDVQLLDSQRPGRYRFHDLVRLYAREHTMRERPDAESQGALSRLIGFYTATSWETIRLLRPGAARLILADSRWVTGGQEFSDARAALNWLEDERPNLMAAIHQAAAGGMPAMPTELPGQLTQALFGLFEIRSYWHDWVRSNQIALEFADRVHDRSARGSALNDLGIAYHRMGRMDDAIASLQESLTISREVEDRLGQATRMTNLGGALIPLGRYEEAALLLRESIRICRELEHRNILANSLINLGLIYRRTDRLEESVTSLEEALLIAQQLGDRPEQLSCLTNLGISYAGLGRYDEAIQCLEESIAISRELGTRRGEAANLNDLGVVYRQLGRHEQAIACQRMSLDISQELDEPEAKAMALRGLGDSLNAVGRIEEAARAWQEGLAISEPLGLTVASDLRERLERYFRSNSDGGG